MQWYQGLTEPRSFVEMNLTNQEEWIGYDKLEVLPEFYYLSDMLSAAKLQAGCGPMLYVYMGQVWPPTPSSHQQPSASVDSRMGVFCLFDLILYVPSTVFQL